MPASIVQSTPSLVAVWLLIALHVSEADAGGVLVHVSYVFACIYLCACVCTCMLLNVCVFSYVFVCQYVSVSQTAQSVTRNR